MGEYEFRVSDKEPTTTTKGNNNNNTSSSSVIGSGVKLQNLQNKMTMMLQQHHSHHNRPFDNDDGPTTYMSSITSSATLGAAAAYAHAHGGAAVVRPLQPFHISAYSSATTTSLKSPAGWNGMAASLGFPFTTTQWKELQRQAMIYKYIMASIPVPSHLLVPITIPTSLDGGFNLRLSRSNNDPEPGRCRRTDGKKWRCARDVAPNHKYCERHMHRGRPRSRKPVEVQQPNSNHQIKKPRHDPNPKFTVANTATKDGSSSQFLDNNYFDVKGFNFGSVSPVSSNKQPRGLEWMLNGDPISLGASSDSGWQSLMHNKVEMNTNQLNSLPLYSSGLDQQNRHLPISFNPLIPMESFHQSEKPRVFIDAWSNADTGESNVNANNKASAASNGKLSLTCLDLSMGGGSVNEDMGSIMEPDENTQHNGDSTKISLSNWLNPTPPWVASPLAEVLRPSTFTTTSDATSNQSGGPLLGTMVSSPSGVLHKTVASFSDSSDNSSPTVASSRANSEIPLLKFN